jgi:competence protein ComEC
LRAGLRLRHRVLEHARKALPAVQASAMNGIVLGASSELPPDLEDDFVRTGTAHILSTSGLHVGMLAAMLIFLLRLCPIPRRLAYLLAIGGLIVFAVMAGCRPAIVRSVIMASIFLLGYVFEREPDLRNTLACAALALLVYDPQNLFDAGFQMSFVTVLTIVLALPRLQGLLGRQREIPPDMRPERKAARYAGNSLVGAFWISLAAQLGAAPLTAYYFNQGAPIALLANLLIMPLIPFVIGLGLLAPLAGAIAPWLAWPLDECLYLTLLGVNGLVQGCATLPGAGIALASPSLLALSVYYLALFGGLLYAPQHGNNASQK